MVIADINPHIRFAEQITYTNERSVVYVRDCRIMYIVDGCATFSLNDQSFMLGKNSVFYCSGDATYAIFTDGPLKLLSLNFDLSQASKNLVLPFTPEEVNVAKNKVPTNKCIIDDSDFLNSYIALENCLEFKPMILDIIDEFSSKKILYMENCSCMIKKVLIEMHRKTLERTHSSFGAVNRALEYISANFTREIKNSEIATLTGYHEYHLNRLFIRHTGTSMHKYIINMRLNEAKKLLLNTDLPLAHIATKVGFNSNTHFSNSFKRETKLTPFEFRNNFKNKI